MVNGLHLYSVFTQSTVQYSLAFSHSYTHSPNDGGVSHARRQPARLEQFGALLRDTSTLRATADQYTRNKYKTVLTVSQNKEDHLIKQEEE
jgi:hypothetical protein